MFFQNLTQLLENNSQVNLTIASADNGQITIIVMPASKGAADPALSTPLALTGTAAELDAEFATLLANYVGSRKSLIEQIEATTTVLEAAKQASQKKATAAITGKTTTQALNAPAPDADDLDEDGDGTSEGKPPVESAPAAPAVTASTNLWD